MYEPYQRLMKQGASYKKAGALEIPKNRQLVKGIGIKVKDDQFALFWVPREGLILMHFIEQAGLLGMKKVVAFEFIYHPDLPIKEGIAVERLKAAYEYWSNGFGRTIQARPDNHWALCNGYWSAR